MILLYKREYIEFMNVQNVVVSKNIKRMYGLLSDGQRQTAGGYTTDKGIGQSEDTAAELYISDRMMHQRNTVAQISAEAQDEISILQIAEKRLVDETDALQKMEELARKAAFDNLSEAERSGITDMASKLIKEIDNISESTRFNELSPLNAGEKYVDDTSGNTGFDKKFGPDARQTINEMRKIFSGAFCDASSGNLGIGELDLSTKKSAGRAVDLVREAKQQINVFRDSFAKEHERLEKVLRSLHGAETDSDYSKSIGYSESASEMLNNSKGAIIKHADKSVVAQANSAASGMMKLLQ